MVEAYVGLGANLGDAISAVRDAFARLGRIPGTRLDAHSRLYRTPAWGVTEQPDFINAVARLHTGLSAQSLLAELLRIEQEAGRERGDASTRWGPRTLDLDLLLYGMDTIDAPGLHVPHPQLHARAFVLVPLLELAPHARLPDGRPVSGLCAAVDASSIVPVE